MTIKVGVYYSRDVSATFLYAFEQNLLLYVEYIRKSDNALRIMEVRPVTIKEDRALVTEIGFDNIRTLLYDNVYRMGLEMREM